MKTSAARIPERIEGRDGLLLRRWTVEDAEALHRAVAESLEHLRPWMDWTAGEPISLARRRARIEEWERNRDQGGDAVFGLFLPGAIAGGCGLHRRLAPGGLEAGYWIHPRFLRRGLATAATSLLLDAAFQLSDVDHVEIHHDKANVASAGVPRKLGFEFLSEEPDQRREAPAELGIEWRWRMTKARWMDRREP